jgi:hypothetical protein
MGTHRNGNPVLHIPQKCLEEIPKQETDNLTEKESTRNKEIINEVLETSQMRRLKNTKTGSHIPPPL